MERMAGRRTRPSRPGHARMRTADAYRIFATAGCIALCGAASGAVMMDEAYAQPGNQTITRILADTGAIRDALDVGRPDAGGSDPQMLAQILADTGAIRDALGIGGEPEADGGLGAIFDLFGSILGGEPGLQEIPRILADTGAIRRTLDIGRPDTGGSDPKMLAQILADTGAIRRALDAQSQIHDTSAGPPTLKPVSSAVDGSGGFNALNGAFGVGVFEVGGRDYAAVAATRDHGVQIIDVTDPARPAPASSIFAGSEGFDALHAPINVDAFDSGGRVYAAVSGSGGLQIIDVTDPARPAPASAVLAGSEGLGRLTGLGGLDVFDVAGRTYAIATADEDNSVVIMDVTDPASPALLSAPNERWGGFEAMKRPTGVAAFDAGHRTYAIVAAWDGSCVLIMDVTDPTEPVPVSAAFDDAGGFEALSGAATVKILNSEGRTYAVVAGARDDGVQIIDVTNPSVPAPVSAVFDGSGGVAVFGNFDALQGPVGVDLFEVGGRDYAAVAAVWDDGVQIIDLTDPASPAAVSAAFDDLDVTKAASAVLGHSLGGFEALAEPYHVDTFSVGDGTYAIVASREDDGVQIIDLTDPASPAAVSAAFDGYGGPGGFDAMAGATHVAAYEMGGRAYAVVTGSAESGVQIMDVTDPASPAPVSTVFPGRGGFGMLTTALSDPTGLDVFGVGDRAYVIVAAWESDGVQIVDVTDPARPAPVSSATDNTMRISVGFEGLDGARDVEVFWSGGRAYAIVAAFMDDAVQIIDITIPELPAPASIARHGENGFVLFGARDTTVFWSEGRAYALVASAGRTETGFHSAVQIVDITDPAAPAPVSTVYDGAHGFEALSAVVHSDVFEAGGGLYAILADRGSGGVQIVDITDPARPAPVSAAHDGEGGFEALGGASGVRVFGAWGGTYAVVSAADSDGVQLIDITDPASPAPVSAAFDDSDGFEALGAPMHVDVFDIGGRLYAIAASEDDDGVQIIEISTGGK